MEIILLENLDKVGDKHEIVSVKSGYARNYLIPQGKALIANDTNRRRLGDLRRREAAKRDKMLDEFKAMATQLEGKSLKIGAKAGTSGKIFGSVTNIQIANALKEQLNLDVDRRMIELPDEVKEVGSYKAVIKFHPEVSPEVDFEVVAE